MRPCFAVCAALFIGASVPLLAQAGAEVVLPKPTGPFSVGRTSLTVYDTRRERRPISVVVWYPAKAAKRRAEYYPGLGVLMRDREASKQLKKVFGPALTAVRSDRQLANSSPDAPIASRGPFPLLLFLPGLALPTFVYSSQLEDLASRGYVVAAVSPPGDAGAAVVDGRVLAFDGALWEQHPPDFGSSKFYSDRANDWAKDLIFALDTLVAASRDPKSWLANAIDLERVGAFGHSQGGRSAATACILDARIRACLNEDGRFDNENLSRPYWPLEKHSFRGAFAMLDWFDPGLTAEELASMHTDLKSYSKAHLDPGPAARAVYEAPERGSFRLTILEPGMSHTTFTDLPFLRAATSNKHADASKRISIVRRAVADFFEQELKGGKDLNRRCGSVEKVTLVQCFGKTEH